MNKALISIIIITLNEEKYLESTIKSVRESAKLKSGKNIPIEIIVSDGGSEDNTVEIAEKLVEKVIIGTRGRFRQLNIGAKEAISEILLFLHADTIIPKEGLLSIIYFLQSPKIVGGCFKKHWDWNKEQINPKLIKFFNFFWQGFGNWSVNLLKIFPGDNAIFIKKKIFEQMNGYSPMWICEDFDLSKRLKNYGKKVIKYIPFPVSTSTRRFEKSGFIRTIWLWCWIYLLWRIGMTQTGLWHQYKCFLNLKRTHERIL
jgi:rSAM/selenodomain-associated transferase 2